MSDHSTHRPYGPSDALAQPRMLVLADSFPNPSESFIADHVRLMGEAGWWVTLLVRQCGPGAAEAGSALGANIRVTRMGGAGVGAYWQAVRWIARRPWAWSNPFMWRCALHGAVLSRRVEAAEHWEVVHAHYGNNAVEALVAKPQWRRRLVANFHGHDATSVPMQHGWTAYRRVLGDAHAVVHSPFMEDTLRQHTDLRVDRVTMGVDLDRFAPCPKPNSWPSPLRLLSVGRLTRQKGHAVAIEALRLLETQYPSLEIRLAIAGDGPERKRLQSLNRRRPLPDRVELMGWVSHADMPALYARYHVMLLPAQPTGDGQQEAFGRAAVEAMASGLPVVGCPIGGLPDTIDRGGVIAEGFDASAIARAIARVLEQASPSAWGERSRNRATEFSIRDMAAGYAALANLIMHEAGNSDAE